MLDYTRLILRHMLRVLIMSLKWVLQDLLCLCVFKVWLLMVLLDMIVHFSFLDNVDVLSLVALLEQFAATCLYLILE